MELVLRSAIRGLEDLTAPGIPKLFFICIGLTCIAAFIAVSGGVWAYGSFISPLLPDANDVGSGLIASLLGMGAWFLFTSFLIIPVFLLFWSFMIVIAGFFDEHIAEKIEQHRYPAMALGKSHPFWPEFWQDIRFMLFVTLCNVLLIIIPLFWPFWPILFPAMNGYLLGKYFFRMAGGRHIGRREADKLAKQHRGKILVAGVGIVIASGVPIINLAVPFWGVAMMVHLYHLIAQPQATKALPVD